MSMSTFRIPIMFKSVGRCSEMSYTMGREKGLKGQKLALIICVKCFSGGGEIISTSCLKATNVE